MKIPFGLHRRIPKVRRVLDLLARTTVERDALQSECNALRQHCSVLQEELDWLRKRNPILERALGEQIAERKPLLYGNTDANMGQTARQILSFLRPMDVSGKRLIRKGKPHDGGYVMVDSGLESVIVYSLGINDDVSWDLDMAALGCEIYQYDHTIDRLPQDHPKFHWFKTGIAAQPSADGVLQPLGDLIDRNGHAGYRDMILKMDIEGFEWGVFGAMSSAHIEQFSQIVLELHTLALAGPDLQSKIVSTLEKLYASHQPVHIHANNHGFFGFVGGVPIADTVEVTYVRRADHTFTECRKVFPTEMDMPCRWDVPDFFLGAMGGLPAIEAQECHH